MCELLRSSLAIPETAQWTSGFEFQSFMHHTTHLKLVFFFDEMDAVLSTKYKDEFLSTLRALRCEPQLHGIKVQLYGSS